MTTFFPLYWLVTSALKSPVEVAQIPISWWPQSWHWESFGFFDRIPRELTDSAQIDGAGTWRIFISIMLPLARPAVGVVIILALIAGWKELLWPLVVLQDEHLWPLEVALLQFGQAKSLAVNIEMAAMTIATFPMIATFILFQQHILKDIALTDSKG